MRKAFYWKRPSISMLKVEAVPQSCIPLSPDWFEYCFIYEKFVACREFWLASEYPVHFGEGDSYLFPFCENVFLPGKSTDKV
jgi:hypothetical protein